MSSVVVGVEVARKQRLIAPALGLVAVEVDLQTCQHLRAEEVP